MNKNKVSIIISIIIFFIIIFEMFFYIQKGIQINKLNNMYKDIEFLEDKIAIYYLNNEELPVYEKNINQIENDELSYGMKKNNINDKYIINSQSHTIYYYCGIKYNNETYYTKNINYKDVKLEEF